MLYTNAQSINSKLEELKVVSHDPKPDIILITETWCSSAIDNAALAIENYRLETDLRMDRNDRHYQWDRRRLVGVFKKLYPDFTERQVPQQQIQPVLHF